MCSFRKANSSEISSHEGDLRELCVDSELASDRANQSGMANKRKASAPTDEGKKRHKQNHDPEVGVIIRAFHSTGCEAHAR